MQLSVIIIDIITLLLHYMTLLSAQLVPPTLAVDPGLYTERAFL